jgi:hypothetical protein
MGTDREPFVFDMSPEYRIASILQFDSISGRRHRACDLLESFLAA